MKELRDANGSLIYGLSEKERPWVELMIKLAEFKLSFEVEIEENQSLLSEVTEFDIEIED